MNNDKKNPGNYNYLLSSTEVLDVVNEYYSFPNGAADNCKLLGRGRNDHYLISSGSDWYIFRVYMNHKYYIKSFSDFCFELDLLAHLHRDQVPVSYPIMSTGGKNLITINTPFGERACALLSYAKGDELRVGTFTHQRQFQVGQLIAKFHLSAQKFETKHSRYNLDLHFMARKPIQQLIEQRNMPESDRLISENELIECEELVEEIGSVDDLVEELESLNISGDGMGIIHSDINFSNMHILHDEITMFDFDHCAYGWRAYDLCMTEQLPEDQKYGLLDGYESVRPLSEEEKRSLPIFAKLKELWDIGDALSLMPLLNKETL